MAPIFFHFGYNAILCWNNTITKRYYETKPSYTAPYKTSFFIFFWPMISCMLLVMKKCHSPISRITMFTTFIARMDSVRNSKASCFLAVRSPMQDNIAPPIPTTMFWNKGPETINITIALDEARSVQSDVMGMQKTEFFPLLLFSLVSPPHH